MKLLCCVFVAGLFLARSAYCVSVLPAEGLHVGTGSTATLSCLADPGREEESVTWLKGDTRSAVAIAGLNDSHISTTQNNLTISNFHYSTHGGIYSCSVEGPSGHTQLSCPVHLQHARILANTTSSVVTKVKEVEVNSTVALVCEAPLSWPPAEFHWEKGGERVEHEADSRLWLLPSGNLYIIGVSVQDEGLYKCTAVNPVTQATRHSRVQYQLTVNTAADPPMNETLPTFTVRPADTIAVVVGGQALIECSGHAHPEPRLEWIIIHGTHFPREGHILPTGALRFDPVTADDAGVYRCLLRNSAGRNHADIRIEVREPPSLVNTPESLMELSLGLGSVGSSNATAANILTCAANGSPPLELLLMHDGNVISSETVTNIGEQVSLSHTITDDGFYQCFATNEFGCEQWTTFVTLDTDISTEAVTEVLASTSERSLTTATSSLNGHTERPLDESTPETLTTTSKVMLTTQTSTSAEPPTMVATNPLTESAERPTTDRAGDSTTPRVLSTSQDTTSPYTPPPVTTPPELDILTNGDSFKALLGSDLIFECEVRGGGHDTQLTWHFNGQPLLGIEIKEKQDSDGGRVLLSQLRFDEVKFSHAGEYMCRAHSLLRNETLTAPITLTVSRLPPPIDLTVSAGERGGLLVTWQPNSYGDKLPDGYKLAWDIPSRVTQTAVTSVPPVATQYLIPGLDLSLEYTVLIWAYNLVGDHDGIPANATWKPGSSVTTTTANSLPNAACVATEMGPTQVLLEWPVEVGGVNITASCLNSHTSSAIPVATVTHTYTLDQMLPDCNYSIRVGGFNCSVTTPPGEVDLAATVHHLDNGSIQLDWSLPRELSVGSDVVVEVDVNGDWIPIHRHGNTPHIPMHFEKDMEHRVQFRFQSGEWVGFAVIIIPSLAQTTSPSTVSKATPKGEEFRLTEYGLIYGVVFGVLVVACASVLVVILVLKYIQMSRRENDKVTDDREKHREEFRRMSLERSSVKSLKKEPVGNTHHPTQTDV